MIAPFIANENSFLSILIVDESIEIKSLSNFSNLFSMSINGFGQSDIIAFSNIVTFLFSLVILGDIKNEPLFIIIWALYC